MAERTVRQDRSGEEGTSLAELLVVILLLGIVGAVTTTGIVQGFNAQLASTNVAETLDGTRIATQRVRDFARGADEVCPGSTSTSLVLWTDDDDDGDFEEGELDIFELIDNGTEDIFQRRVPLAGTDDQVQLIRDDIIESALFDYDIPPAEQTNEILCTEGTLTTPGHARTRSVDVTFLVANPDPAGDPLETNTTVQLRNAGLEAAPESAPTADFEFTCPAGTEECSFDGTLSGDLDGSVVAWEWDFGGDGTATGAEPTHDFTVGDVDYQVKLTVTDDDGQTDFVFKEVRPGLTFGNATPLADFTVDCTGLTCAFTSTSTDDGSITDWTWDFGDGSPPASGPSVSHPYGESSSYVVRLTVTDDGDPPKFDDKVRTVTASTRAMVVDSITGTGTVPSGSPSRWTATIDVQLAMTTTGTPGNGILISGTASSSNTQDVSCSTDSNGHCTITVTGINATKSLKFTVTQVQDPNTTDPDRPYEYDEDQNEATALIVYDSRTTSAP